MKPVLLYGLLLLSWPCFAQKEAVPLPYTLKMGLFNFINPYQQSIDIISDIPFSSRWGLELGVSAVTGSQAFARYDGESYTGLKFRPAVKWYYNTSGRTLPYIALACKYNNIYNKQYRSVTRQGGQYIENVLSGQRLVTWGAAIRSGAQYYMGKRKRWMLDFSVGIGFRQRNISAPTIPEDAVMLQSGNFIWVERDPGHYVVIDAMFGLSLGYVIAKQKSKSPPIDIRVD